MRRATKILMGAIAGVGMLAMTSTAPAAPIINTSIVLLDSTNTAYPQVGGVYQVPAGATIRVELDASVSSPNSSDASHTDRDTGDPLPVISLGIQNLTADIKTPGTNGLLTPVTKTGSSPAQWAGNTAAINAQKLALPASVNFTFTNLNDVDADGDLDPNGAGYNNGSLVYDTGTNTGNGESNDTAELQGLANGLGTQIGVIRGTYLVGALGSGTMIANVTSNNVFGENPAADNSLSASPAAVNNTPISFAIVPVPEPTSLSLLALGGLALVRRRRA